MELWPLKFRESIPVVPVPILAPDPDVALDLGSIIHDLYDRADYDIRIDYRVGPLPPKLSKVDTAWAQQRVGTVNADGEQGVLHCIGTRRRMTRRVKLHFVSLAFLVLTIGSQCWGRILWGSTISILATASAEGTDCLDVDGVPLNAAFRSFDDTNMDADFLIATTPDNGTG